MRTEVTFAELDSQNIELLPARETLYVHANWANLWASNSSLALNAASFYSSATSNATQTITVTQS